MATLIAHYKMDDSEPDKVVLDTQGNNGVSITNTEDISFPGKINECLHFDGSEKITVPVNSTTSVFDITTQMSLAFWIKRDGDVEFFDYIVAKRAGAGSPDNYSIELADDNAINFWVHTIGGGFAGIGGIPISTDWEHWVITYDTGDVKFYKNGSESSTFVLAGTIPSLLEVNTEDFIIGGSTGSSSFLNAFLDDVRFYNEVLTLSDILQLYNTGVIKINIGDSFKDVENIKINIDDAWKEVLSIKQNIGDVWKDVF